MMILVLQWYYNVATIIIRILESTKIETKLCKNMVNNNLVLNVALLHNNWKQISHFVNNDALISIQVCWM